MERLAIITISIGDRSWLNLTTSTMRTYAEACKADFFVERFPPPHEELPLPDLPGKPGRRNKIAYAAKSFFPWQYMAKYGYDRVLLLDDTCCIRRGAENIFNIVPRGLCGIKSSSSSRHAQISFKFIDNLVKQERIKGVIYNKQNYMNSAVMLYDRIYLDSISPAKIIDAADLLFCRYPHQTLAYYLFARGKVPLFHYPGYFNSIPALELPGEKRKKLNDVRPYIEDNVKIYHVTGFFKKRHRIIRQICEHFLNEA